MKIRTGFVSNSSSTSYVVALTRDFVASPEKIQKFLGSYRDWEDEDITDEQGVELIGKVVEALCSSREIWIDDYNDKLDGLDTFLSVFGDEISVASMDVSSEAGIVTNIFADRNKEKSMEILKKVMGLQNEDS